MERAELIETLRSSINDLVAGDTESHAVTHRRNQSESVQGPYGNIGRTEAQTTGFSQQGDETQAEASNALKKIVVLVNVSERSVRSLRDRLSKEGFSDAAIDESIRKAQEYGLVDDARFADLLIRSRISQGKGSAGIERELKQNDIDPYTVQGWPEEYFPDDTLEIDRALELLVRRPPHCKNLKEGAFRRLVQKGYPVSVASSASRIWFEGLSR